MAVSRRWDARLLFMSAWALNRYVVNGNAKWWQVQVWCRLVSWMTARAVWIEINFPNCILYCVLRGRLGKFLSCFLYFVTFSTVGMWHWNTKNWRECACYSLQAVICGGGKNNYSGSKRGGRGFTSYLCELFFLGFSLILHGCKFIASPIFSFVSCDGDDLWYAANRREIWMSEEPDCWFQDSWRFKAPFADRFYLVVNSVHSKLLSLLIYRSATRVFLRKGTNVDCIDEKDWIDALCLQE